MLESIDILFPFLNSGGLYVCEDIHTSITMENHRSVIYYLKNYLHYKSTYISEEGHDYFKTSIKKINFYMRDSIPLKCTSSDLPNEHRRILVNPAFCKAIDNKSPSYKN